MIHIEVSLRRVEYCIDTVNTVAAFLEYIVNSHRDQNKKMRMCSKRCATTAADVSCESNYTEAGLHRLMNLTWRVKTLVTE